MATAKRKPKLVVEPVPEPVETLQDRVVQLLHELDVALNAIAEERRRAAGGHTGPGAQPLGVIRMMLDSKGYGNCPCRSYLAAVQD
jgi:hypothetical protein